MPNAARPKLTVLELHKALGYVSQTAIVHAIKMGLIKGVELDSTSQPRFCDTCVKANTTCQLFLKKTESRAKHYGERVHMDLWGPSQTASIGGCTYYMSFTDDYSQETKLHFLKAKSNVLAAFKQYEVHLLRQNQEVRILKLRSDQGGEYLSAEFNKHLHGQGIERELTVHDSPEQNSVAEHLNQMLISHA